MSHKDFREHSKKFGVKIVPVVLIVLVTIALFAVMYYRMIHVEIQECWERLDVATISTEEKIRMCFADSINMLKVSSDSLELKSNLEDEEHISSYLKKVREMTICEQVGIIYPDSTMLVESGECIPVKGELEYEELLAIGEHISPRCRDEKTGKEVLYFFSPVTIDEQIQALLVGTIDCQTLTDRFKVYSYEGEAQIYLIDRKDGSILMDNWHDTLGNIQDWDNHKMCENYEEMNIVSELMNGEIGKAAYISNTNGKVSYMYYRPVEGFDWEVCVAVQDDMALQHVKQLEDNLVIFAIVECLLLIIYLLWNVVIISLTVKNEEKVRKMELQTLKNEAKERFLANMSHDIRTPLNGIMGMISIIKAHEGDTKLIKSCLAKIDVSTHYLATLANDMLDISEIENGKMTLTEEWFDLRKFADDLNILVQQKMKSENVSYYMDYSALTHPYVYGGKAHIHRVLVNIISNAIKYSKKENAEVRVSIEEVDIDGEFGVYRFKIQDNGIGMSDEFQKMMFDAFEQEKTTSRSKYEGYGLGLTIVKRLVQAMRGTIGVRSKKDEGSIFTVTIPLKVGDESMMPVFSEKEIVDLKGMNILVAEDNELNMEIAEILLSDAGAVVTKACDGKQVVDIFENSKPYEFDIILMDIMMPELDGCEATEMIRAMERKDAKKIPIVAMTASIFSEEQKRYKDVGMNDYISKPLEVDVLLGKLSIFYKKR